MGRTPDLTSEDGTSSHASGEWGALIKPPPLSEPSLLLCETARLLLSQAAAHPAERPMVPVVPSSHAALCPPPPSAGDPAAPPAPGQANKSMNPRPLPGGWLIVWGLDVPGYGINAPRLHGLVSFCEREFEGWLFSLLPLREQSGPCGSDTGRRPLASARAAGAHASQPPPLRKKASLVAPF